MLFRSSVLSVEIRSRNSGNIGSSSCSLRAKPAGSVSLDILALLHNSHVDMARVCASFCLGGWGGGRDGRRGRRNNQAQECKSPGRHRPGLLRTPNALCETPVVIQRRFTRRCADEQLTRTSIPLLRNQDHVAPLRKRTWTTTSKP